MILELSDDPDSIQLFAPDVRHLNPRYRLYRAEYFGGELNEGDTLAQLKVRNNETFILSPRRNTLPQTVSRIREVPGPNEQLVESATRYVPVNCNQLPTIDINEIFQQSNVSTILGYSFDYSNPIPFPDPIRCAKGVDLFGSSFCGGYRSWPLCSTPDSYAKATFDQSPKSASGYAAMPRGHGLQAGASRICLKSTQWHLLDHDGVANTEPKRGKSTGTAGHEYAAQSIFHLTLHDCHQ